MRVFVLVVLLAACGNEPAPQKKSASAPQPATKAGPAAQPERKTPAAEWPEVELPGAWKAWKDKPEEGRLVLTLDKNGNLFRDGDDRSLSLDDLDGICRDAVAEVDSSDRRPRLAGARASGVSEVSEVSVLLRVDANASWHHVQWVMTILAENKIYRRWFAVYPAKLAGQKSRGPAYKLKAFLPRWVVRPDQSASQQRYGARTQVVMREGAGVVYRYGERETAKKKELLTWIKSEYDAALRDKLRPEQLYGEVGAAHGVPAGAAIAVTSMYLRVGFPEVSFYGRKIPRASTRAAAPLPPCTSPGD